MLSKWMRADYSLFYKYAVPTHQIGLIELAMKKKKTKKEQQHIGPQSAQLKMVE